MTEISAYIKVMRRMIDTLLEELENEAPPTPGHARPLNRTPHFAGIAHLAAATSWEPPAETPGNTLNLGPNTGAKHLPPFVISPTATLPAFEALTAKLATTTAPVACCESRDDCDGPECQCVCHDAVVYEIPGAPPTERRVTDGTYTWQRQADGHWIDVAHPEPLRWGWGELLAEYGPLTLVPLTPQDHADTILYGPPGARWGNPAVPCEYFTAAVVGGQVAGVCALGTGHVGAHTDSAGQALGQTTAADAPPIYAGVTPYQASQTPCTCGHPEQHRRGCARYNRWYSNQRET